MTDTHSGLPFRIAGAEGEIIRGNMHLPPERPGRLPLLLICHGFKGYKDYGFFPYLAQRLADQANVAAVRFNFSHCGIDDDPATFGRPDLFERDCWTKQLVDVQSVVAAAETGQLPAADKLDLARLAIAGHSRGGVVALLSASRDRRFKAVISLAAPSGIDNLSEQQKRAIRQHGYAVSPSSRTGQELHIGRAWLADIEAHRDSYDLPSAIRQIDVPLLIVHGTADASVPVEAADEIAAACRGPSEQLILDGANHVFNCANPMTQPSPALEQLISVASAFLRKNL